MEPTYHYIANIIMMLVYNNCNLIQTGVSLAMVHHEALCGCILVCWGFVAEGQEHYKG